MALSNAERQKRYRQRLIGALARIDELEERIVRLEALVTPLERTWR